MCVFIIQPMTVDAVCAASARHKVFADIFFEDEKQSKCTLVKALLK